MAEKAVALLAVPPGVVTAMGPVLTPAGAVAVIWESALTLNEAALMPLNVTEVAPAKCSPVTVTTVPALPLAGVKLVMAGAGSTVKLEGL